ncbi:MAG: hypothetical protein R2710_27345 [Acidimicrobiales bacterium]
MPITSWMVLRPMPFSARHSKPPGHEDVVVGLVASGSCEELDPGALGDGDPDLRHQHPLDVEGDDGLLEAWGRGVLVHGAPFWLVDGRLPTPASAM